MKPSANEMDLLVPDTMLRAVRRKLGASPAGFDRHFQRYVKALIDADLRARFLPPRVGRSTP